MNARTRAGSFFPRLPGTSVWVKESTPHGRTAAIACATLSAESPPARITGIRERSTTARATDQSCVSPRPLRSPLRPSRASGSRPSPDALGLGHRFARAHGDRAEQSHRRDALANPGAVLGLDLARGDMHDIRAAPRRPSRRSRRDRPPAISATPRARGRTAARIPRAAAVSIPSATTPGSATTTPTRSAPASAVMMASAIEVML